MPDLQETLDLIPVARAVAMRVEQTDDGLTFTAEIGADNARYDGASQAHGGAAASILDTAATFAVLAHAGEPWVTLEMNVNYLRGVPLGPVHGTATIFNRGRTVALVRTELHDERGRCCVEASVLMMLPPKREG